MNELIVTTISATEMKELILEAIREYFSKTPARNNPDEDEIGGMELAMRITGLKAQTIYGLVSKRLIPFSKPGKILYFSRNELLEWIRSGRKRTRSEIDSLVPDFRPSKNKKSRENSSLPRRSNLSGKKC